MRQPRRLAAFAAVSLLMLLAAACGGNDATETEEATATEAATSEAAATEEATTEAAATEEATTEAAATEEATTEAAATEESHDRGCRDRGGRRRLRSGHARGPLRRVRRRRGARRLQRRPGHRHRQRRRRHVQPVRLRGPGRPPRSASASRRTSSRPQNEADYENNLDTILGDEPDVVVTVGFLLADATAAKSATENPDVMFIGVDQFVPSTRRTTSACCSARTRAASSPARWPRC